MNNNGRNLELPRTFVKKMMNLRKKYSSVYFYLLKAVKKSIIEAQDQISALDLDVERFQFDMVKDPENDKCLLFSWRVLTKDRSELVLTDHNCNIKTRMQNFHKLESDMDFIITFLYFVSKVLDIPYLLVSDSLFEQKIKSKTTDIADKDNKHFLKSIEIDLKQL